MTPLELLTYRRIERASQELIADRDRSITDIALDLGFQSSQYFATTFRKQTGIFPREYRAGTHLAPVAAAEGTTSAA